MGAAQNRVCGNSEEEREGEACLTHRTGDRRKHHLFQLFLYQVATVMLNAAAIAVLVRAILREQPHVEVLLAEAVAVDVDQRRVRLHDGALDYDYAP
jgi:NADH dehydrogenase FAD-containing subunit